MLFFPEIIGVELQMYNKIISHVAKRRELGSSSGSFWGSFIKILVFFLFLDVAFGNKLNSKNPVTREVSAGGDGFVDNLDSLKLTQNELNNLEYLNKEELAKNDAFGWSLATRAAFSGDVVTLKTLYGLYPELLSQFDQRGWTTATLAANEGNVEVLKFLHKLNPELLSEFDQGGWTPATRAVYDGKVEVLKVLYELNPKLLSEFDQGGGTPATRAANKGNVEVLKVLYALKPELLSQFDQYGWTAVTLAVHNENLNVLEVLHQLDPKLLSEFDRGGWTPATRAANEGNVEVLKFLHKLNPELLSEFDQGGWTPATRAAYDGKVEVLKVLYELNPKLLVVKDAAGRSVVEIILYKNAFFSLKIYLGLMGCTIIPFIWFISRQNKTQTNTTINVHAGDRDQKTIDAFFKLKAHIQDRGGLPKDYLVNNLLADFGLQKITSETLPEILMNKQMFIGKSLYFRGMSYEECILAKECFVQDIREEDQQTIFEVKVLPELGKQELDDQKNIVFGQTVVRYGETEFSLESVRVYIQNGQGTSIISEAFRKNSKFRYGLGFATDAALSSKLFKPLLLSVSIKNDTRILGQEAISLAHYFCKMNPSENEILQRQAAFIGGIKNGMVPSAENEKTPHIVCEPGQLQYLLATLLQGRLAGVEIDDTTTKGLEAIVPTCNVLVMEATREAQLKKADATQAAFWTFTREDYIPNNVFLSNPKHGTLKEEFITAIGDFARYLDSDES